MPEMHLRWPGYVCSTCEPFAKNKQKKQKYKETTDSKYIDQNDF